MYVKTFESAKELVASKVDDPKVVDMFVHCFEDTLKHKITFKEDGTAFVQTGDIPAMWLRDSSLQMRPYLPFLREDPELQELIKKVVKRQMKYILIDPYANAFNAEANGNRWDDDIPLQEPDIWERKYEIDSLCFPVQLAYQYWRYTHDASIFDDTFKEALLTIISVWKVEQHHERNSTYTFQRPGRKNMLMNEGSGSKVGYTGMTWSGFRPSDDACEYHYLVPSNCLAAHVLDLMKEIAVQIYSDSILEMSASHLAKEIRAGIAQFALQTVNGKQLLAYEVNGLGDVNLMDDRNMPSLLSLPLVTDLSVTNKVYQHTRKFVLSKENPYYYEGTYLKGIGSPHTRPGYVWPMAVAVEGLTSTSREKRWDQIQLIASTDAGTNFVHESVNPDNPEQFSREWFSWANAMFCELVLDYCGVAVQFK